MSTSNDRPEPLPKEWLPDSPVPPEGDEAYWSAQLGRLMAEAEPILSAHRSEPADTASWMAALAVRWRPAAVSALALAASMVLAFVWQAEHMPTPSGRTIVLSTIVGEGQPAAIWKGAGVEADPTLALLALESGTQQGEQR